MTRWKREQTATLIIMHAHNQWSQWNEALLTAAETMGLPVAMTAYPNSSNDGSWDKEYYTSFVALDKVGGMHEVRQKATEIHEKLMS